MNKIHQDIVVCIAGDYSLSSYYPFSLNKLKIDDKKAILYPLDKLNKLFSKSFTLINFEATLFLDFFKKINKSAPAIYLEGHPSTVSSLKFGNIDVVSLANNHSLDGGGDGLKKTLKILEKNQIRYVGVGNNLKKALAPRYFLYKGYKLAVIAINTICGKSCIDAPMVVQDEGIAVASVDLGDGHLKMHKKIVTESIQQAKGDQSDIVIVYYHWGNEHDSAVTKTQIMLATEAAEAGADLIVGTHQHIVQGIKIYETSDGRKVPIAFGLGHLLFGAIPNPKENWSIILEAVFKKDAKTGKTILTKIKPIPITTNPSAREPFQPNIVQGRERQSLLKLIAKRSEAIELS